MTELNKLTLSVDFDTTKFDKKIKKLKKKIKKVTNMKYKIGDKVKVREDLDAGVCYGIFPNNAMVTLAGKTVTISEVNSTDYFIEEDEWCWTDNMFSGLVEDEPKYYVQVNGGYYGYLNVRLVQDPCDRAGKVFLGSMFNGTGFQVDFTVSKGLKLLRKYAKNHEIDLTTVKFIPVEEPELKYRAFYQDSDGTKRGLIKDAWDGHNRFYNPNDGSPLGDHDYLKGDLLKALSELSDEIDPYTLRIQKVED